MEHHQGVTGLPLWEMGWHWRSHSADANRGFVGFHVVGCFAESWDMRLAEEFESGSLAVYRELDGVMFQGYLLAVLLSWLV